MAGYKATFSDGLVKTLKNSKREYSHAWRASGENADGYKVGVAGWSRTRELAERSARSEISRIVGVNDKRRPGKITSIEIVPAEKIEAAR